MLYEEHKRVLSQAFQVANDIIGRHNNLISGETVQVKN